MKTNSSNEKNRKYLKFEAELNCLLNELQEKNAIEDFLLVDDLKQSIIIFALKDEFEEKNEIFLDNTKNIFYESIKRIKNNHPNIKTSNIESFMKEFYFDKFDRDMQKEKAIKSIKVISQEDYLSYGCPKCGCGNAKHTHMILDEVHDGVCRECGEKFIILLNGIKQHSVGLRFNVNGNEIVIKCPDRQEHPRKGIPWHPWTTPDLRPPYGEYFTPRGIGYDLSGFVKSKEAGERILEMVKQVLNKEKVDNWLDYRPDEPKWIQFKIQDHEFNVEKLEKLVINNDNILTKEILIECKL